MTDPCFLLVEFRNLHLPRKGKLIFLWVAQKTLRFKNTVTALGTQTQVDDLH